MCGIVGVAGNTSQKELKMFRDMLVFDTVRGFDSTGIAFVPNFKNEVTVEKELYGPENLWSYGSSQLLDGRGVPKVSHRVLLGHNRAATLGKVMKDNAHPFQFNGVTGVHNGTLEDWDDLERDEDGLRFDVDSKALLKTIGDKGVEHAWKNYIGDTSLVWWDEKDETLNFARNEGRPMYLAWSLKGDVLFWASEAWMIRIAAMRNNVALREHKDVTKDKDGVEKEETYTIYPTAVHKHFSFTVTPNSVTLKEGKELVKKTRPVRITSGSGGTIIKTGNINTFWANGLSKADKELRGRPLVVTGEVTHYQSGHLHPCFTGHYTDGNKEKLYLYPRTMDEYEDFKSELSHVSLEYILACRPRVRKDYRGNVYAYCAEVGQLLYSAKNKEEYSKKKLTPVKESAEVIHLHTTYGDKKVSEEAWKHNMKQRGSCCDFCGVIIDMNDSEECLWLPSSVICGGCISDGSYANYMGNNKVVG